jgi:hypothetical protein
MLVAASEPWYDLRWFEWVGVTGLPLAWWGLWLTWAQAKRATSAAVATEKAVQRTQQQLQANQLLLLIPQLRLISAELGVAIEDNNRTLARRQLENWRGQASNLHGILSGANPEQQELLALLQQSIGIASSAGSSLLQSTKNKTVKSIVLNASVAIGQACDALNAWAGRRATEVSPR